jgi:hypothetical protein
VLLQLLIISAVLLTFVFIWSEISMAAVIAMDDFQQNLVFVEKVAGKISGLFLA